MLRVDNLPSPQPLFPNFAHANVSVVSAYKACRSAERLIDLIQDPAPPSDEIARAKLINIRILGHLLCQSHLLSEYSISEVARAVLCCWKGSRGAEEADVEELNKLGEFYRNHLLGPFRKSNQRSSEHEGEEDDDDDSSPLSRSPFHLTEGEVDQMLSETPMSCSTLRKLALHRENYRCAVTRILDYECALRLRIPNGGMYDSDVDPLGICRILPSSPYSEQGENTRDSCTDEHAVLSSLGYTDIVNSFATAYRGQSLENVMVLTKSLLRRFDVLDTWFEPMEDDPNCYRICSILKPPHGLTKGQPVTFQSMDPRLPLPNRELLCIHAACCRVAHLSGASDVFHQRERDMASNPDPTVEAAEFAKALHAHLEDLSFTHTKAI